MDVLQEVAPAIQEYSVSEISATLKRMIEQQFRVVRIRGEISGLKLAPSGHAYFSLKDENAVLAAVCWKGNWQRLQCTPQDGLEVVCTGTLTIYPGQSKYQLVVEQVAPAGVGALMALLEQRKKKLAAEGLFDTARKKPLPTFPEVIGVITSPTGAVIRDILHRLEDRYPLHVVIWPVLVQGDQAAGQVTAAIEGFNRGMPGLPRPDLLIVARGGGSIEDLWPFNEESVVRAAAHSKIPLISAVGHETDTTLIDYAADMRAPTPTAAAEMAVPERAILLAALADYQGLLLRCLSHMQRLWEHRLEKLVWALPRVDLLLAQVTQRMDDISERFAQSLGRFVTQQDARYVQLQGRLQIGVLRFRYQQAEEKLSLLAAMLESYNYASVLKRGFVAAFTQDGTPITHAAHFPSAAVSLEFQDGRVVVERKKS